MLLLCLFAKSQAGGSLDRGWVRIDESPLAEGGSSPMAERFLSPMEEGGWTKICVAEAAGISVMRHLRTSLAELTRLHYFW